MWKNETICIFSLIGDFGVDIVGFMLLEEIIQGLWEFNPQ